MNVVDLNKPQEIHCNNPARFDLGSAFAAQFFSRCFDWFRVADSEGKKIRIVIEYDPTIGKTIAQFSKCD